MIVIGDDNEKINKTTITKRLKFKNIYIYFTTFDTLMRYFINLLLNDFLYYSIINLLFKNKIHF